jgi:capsular exopolysaccharide synthesis family protein
VADLAKAPTAGVPAAYGPRPESIWIDEYLDDKQGEIGRYVQILAKRWKIVVGVAVLAFAGAATWMFFAPRVYTSSVNIQIDPEQTILPYKEMYAAVTPDPRYLGTQAQVLKSEALAQRTVSRLKLASDPEKLNRTARWFTGNIVVTPIEGTQVVKVAYKSDDPAFAAKAVNALADEYIRYGFESKREGTSQARDFLNEELNKQRAKLEQSQQRLVDYARAHNIVESGDNNVVRRKVAELNSEITTVEGEVLANQYEALQDTPIESFPEKLKTAVMRDLDTRRSDLEQKLATATAKFGPKWPEVLTLNQQLDEVRAQLGNEKKRAIRQAKVEYDLAVAHRERLQAALATQNRLADQLTQDSIQYDILKREVDTDRQLHEGLLQRLKETDVSTGVRPGNVHIIDVGHVPTLPTSPNIPMGLALGLTLGLIAGAICAVGVEFLDRTIKTPEDVERELRVAFLGAIPAFDKAWKDASGGHLMPLETSQQNPSLPAPAASAVYWESYRAVRTSLLFSPDNRPHSILVTSAVAGEGKSTTSVNLAIALAQTGARTLILELDMRKPRLADRLGLPTDRGISRYLSGQSQFHTEIQQSTIPNLFVVLAGPIPPNPPELIGSPRMGKVLELLRRHFDYVIVDGPPVTPLTDALVIAPQLNGVVLVVDGHTAREKAQKARNLLRSVDAKVLGVLINNVKMDIATDDYYYSYADYGRSPKAGRNAAAVN